MEDFKYYGVIRKQLEVLNITVGALLAAIAAIYLVEGEFESAASWFIFGCMYIVMDEYCPSEACTSKRVKIDIFKYVISILALVATITLLTYLILR